MVAAAAAIALAIAAAEAAAAPELPYGEDEGRAPPIIACKEAACMGSNPGTGGTAPLGTPPEGNPLYGFSPAAPNIC